MSLSLFLTVCVFILGFIYRYKNNRRILKVEEAVVVVESTIKSQGHSIRKLKKSVDHAVSAAIEYEKAIEYNKSLETYAAKD